MDRLKSSCLKYGIFYKQTLQCSFLGPWVYWQ